MMPSLCILLLLFGAVQRAFCVTFITYEFFSDSSCAVPAGSWPTHVRDVCLPAKGYPGKYQKVVKCSSDGHVVRNIYYDNLCGILYIPLNLWLVIACEPYGGSVYYKPKCDDTPRFYYVVQTKYTDPYCVNFYETIERATDVCYAADVSGFIANFRSAMWVCTPTGSVQELRYRDALCTDPLETVSRPAACSPNPADAYSSTWTGCGTTANTPLPPGTVVGDPITYYGDLRIDFKLPVDTPTLLIASPHIRIFGVAFQGAKEDHWIKRVTVVTGKNRTMADISIRPELVTFSRSALSPQEFETMDVAMLGHEQYLPSFPPSDGYWDLDEVTITFARPELSAENREKDVPRRECAILASRSLKLSVCSASAFEWFGYSLDSYQQAHLDLAIADMQTNGVPFEGVLPELWGLAPRSNETCALIKEESGERPLPGQPGTSSVKVAKVL